MNAPCYRLAPADYATFLAAIQRGPAAVAAFLAGLPAYAGQRVYLVGPCPAVPTPIVADPAPVFASTAREVAS